MNAALGFLVCVGVLFALIGVFLSPSLMYCGLILAAPSYLGLVARHINPEGHK